MRATSPARARRPPPQPRASGRRRAAASAAQPARPNRPPSASSVPSLSSSAPLLAGSGRPARRRAPSPSTTCTAPIATANSSSGSSASAEGRYLPHAPSRRTSRLPRSPKSSPKRTPKTIVQAAPASATQVRPASAGPRAASDRRARSASSEQHGAVADVPDHGAEHQRQEERHQQRRIERAGARKVEEADERLERSCHARVAHQQRRLGVARRGREVLDEDGGSEPRVDLAAQARELAPRHPALGDERALRRGELVEPRRAARARRRRARAGTQSRRHAAAGAPRARARRRRSPREARRSGAASPRRPRAARGARTPRAARRWRTCARPSSARTACWWSCGNTTRQPIAAVVDARPHQLERGRRAPRRARSRSVSTICSSSVLSTSATVSSRSSAQLLVVEVGELGHEREQPPERLEVAGQDQTLVTERVQSLAQGLDLRPRGAPARRASHRRPSRLGAGERAARQAASAEQRVGLRREQAQLLAARRTVPPRRPARRPRPRRARRRSPRGRAGEALRRRARPRAAAEDPHLRHRDEHALGASSRKQQPR